MGWGEEPNSTAITVTWVYPCRPAVILLVVMVLPAAYKMVPAELRMGAHSPLICLTHPLFLTLAIRPEEG